MLNFCFFDDARSGVGKRTVFLRYVSDEEAKQQGFRSEAGTKGERSKSEVPAEVEKTAGVLPCRGRRTAYRNPVLCCCMNVSGAATSFVVKKKMRLCFSQNG